MSAKKSRPSNERFFAFNGTNPQYIALLERGYYFLRDTYPEQFEIVRTRVISTTPKDHITVEAEPRAVASTSTARADSRSTKVRECCALLPKQSGAPLKQTQPAPSGEVETTYAQGPTACVDLNSTSRKRKAPAIDGRTSWVHVNPSAAVAKSHVAKHHVVDSRAKEVGSKAQSGIPRLTVTEPCPEGTASKKRASTSDTSDTPHEGNTHRLHLDRLPSKDGWVKKRAAFGLDNVKGRSKFFSCIANVNPGMGFDDVRVSSLEELKKRVTEMLREKDRFKGITCIIACLFVAACIVFEYLAKQYLDRKTRDSCNDCNRCKDCEDRVFLETALGINMKTLKTCDGKVRQTKSVRELTNGWLDEILSALTGCKRGKNEHSLNKLKKGVCKMITLLENVYAGEGDNCVFELLVYWAPSLNTLSQATMQEFTNLERCFRDILPEPPMRKSIPLNIALLLQLWWPFSYTSVCDALNLKHLTKEQFDQFLGAYKGNTLESYLDDDIADNPTNDTVRNTPYHVSIGSPQSTYVRTPDGQGPAKRRRTTQTDCLPYASDEYDENNNQALPDPISASQAADQAHLLITEHLSTHSTTVGSTQASSSPNNQVGKPRQRTDNSQQHRQVTPPGGGCPVVNECQTPVQGTYLVNGDVNSDTLIAATLLTEMTNSRPYSGNDCPGIATPPVDTSGFTHPYMHNVITGDGRELMVVGHFEEPENLGSDGVAISPPILENPLDGNTDSFADSFKGSDLGQSAMDDVNWDLLFKGAIDADTIFRDGIEESFLF